MAPVPQMLASGILARGPDSVETLSCPPGDEALEDRQKCAGDGFDVRAFPLQHTKTCVGYTLEEHPRPGAFNPDRARDKGVPCGPLWSRLQAGESVTASDGTVVTPGDVMGAPRKGRKFSYVTDTKYIPTIAAEVAGSDLLVCEGMFEQELAETAAEKKHMTAQQAGIIARDARVKKMALIHYSPRYTDPDLKTLLAEAKAIFPETVPVRPPVSRPWG